MMKTKNNMIDDEEFLFDGLLFGIDSEMKAIRINSFKKIKMKFNIIFIAIILTG